MTRKNISIEEFEDDYFDDDDYDVESSRYIYHRKHARQKHLFRRRVEDLLEEKELRERDSF